MTTNEIVLAIEKAVDIIGDDIPNNHDLEGVDYAVIDLIKAFKEYAYINGDMYVYTLLYKLVN